MTNLHEYFVAASEIWKAYFSGRISSAAREAELRYLRSQLPSLPPSPK